MKGYQLREQYYRIAWVNVRGEKSLTAFCTAEDPSRATVSIE